MARGNRKKEDRKKNSGANLGFEQQLWAAADALRGSMDAAEYKHVVLGLIFLKYISDAFEAKGLLQNNSCMLESPSVSLRRCQKRSQSGAVSS